MIDESRLEDLIAEALLRKLSDYVLERYGTKRPQTANDLVLRAHPSNEGLAEDELDAALENIISHDNA